MKQGLVELIFANGVVNSSSKLVALYVARYCYRNGEPLARPPVARLARRLGMDRQTAHRAIRNLGNHGLMTKDYINGTKVFVFIGAWAS